MGRAWACLVLVSAAAGCGSPADLADGAVGTIDGGADGSDGPIGVIDARVDAADFDAAHVDAADVDAAHVDATETDAATPADGAPADAATPPDGAAGLLPLYSTGADLGLVEAGVPGIGYVRFDNNSGADIVLTTAYSTGADYTVVDSTCTGTIPDQGWCLVQVQVIPTSIGARPGQVTVGGPAGVAHADVTATGGGRLNVVLAGAGTGSVSAYGLLCPGTCTTVTSYGAAQAYAGHASTFVGWDEPGCGSSILCYFTVTLAPKTITATFAVHPNARKLTIDVTGTGKGAVAVAIAGDQMTPCLGPSCNYWFLPGDQIRIEATAGSVFDSWSGQCTGSATECIFTGMVNTTTTASFSPDPYERVTFIRPAMSSASPAEELDPDGNRIVTDGSTITAYDPGGVELWTMPVVQTGPALHNGYGVVPDYVGGTWALQPDPVEGVELRHFDAGGNLLEFIPWIGQYDATIVGDPSTGIPVIASTGHSTWGIRRPGITLMSDDVGDFANDIAHCVVLDSTYSIVAARPKHDYGWARGIARVRYGSPGDYVSHEAIDYGYGGILFEGVGTGPDGVVAYSGELLIGPDGSYPLQYRWIQVLDYVP